MVVLGSRDPRGEFGSKRLEKIRRTVGLADSGWILVGGHIFEEAECNKIQACALRNDLRNDQQATR